MLMSSLNRDDIEVYFEVYGSGTPFLFFSETACAGDIWSTYQVPEFSRDHRVITHDYRGTGKSSKPTIQYSCEDFVDDAVAILDHLNAGPVIGCSQPICIGERVSDLIAGPSAGPAAGSLRAGARCRQQRGRRATADGRRNQRRRTRQSPLAFRHRGTRCRSAERTTFDKTSRIGA